VGAPAVGRAPRATVGGSGNVPRGNDAMVFGPVQQRPHGARPARPRIDGAVLCGFLVDSRASARLGALGTPQYPAPGCRNGCHDLVRLLVDGMNEEDGIWPRWVRYAVRSYLVLAFVRMRRASAAPAASSERPHLPRFAHLCGSEARWWCLGK